MSVWTEDWPTPHCIPWCQIRAWDDSLLQNHRPCCHQYHSNNKIPPITITRVCSCTIAWVKGITHPNLPIRSLRPREITHCNNTKIKFGKTKHWTQFCLKNFSEWIIENTFSMKYWFYNGIPEMSPLFAFPSSHFYQLSTMGIY